MKCVFCALLALVLLLCGCAGRKPGGADPADTSDPADVSFFAEASLTMPQYASEEESSPKAPFQDFTPANLPDEGAFTVAVQEGEEGLELLLTRDGQETVFTTPTLEEETDASQVMVIPFTGLIGHEGFCEIHAQASTWYLWYYYGLTENGPVCLGEGFGFDGQDDYAVDLDGDGITELVSNCTYGGDGVLKAFVYSMEEGAVCQWTVDTAALISEDAEPVNATSMASWYDSKTGTFTFHYAPQSGDEIVSLTPIWPEDFARKTDWLHYYS